MFFIIIYLTLILGFLFNPISELKVTEQERRDWIKEKAEYQGKIADYKKHKKALEEREKQLGKI